MSLYVPHASFGDLRDWLDAAWRLFYPERVAELQALGQSLQLGDPLDVLAPAVCRARSVAVGTRIWQTVEPPVALVVADGAGEYLARLAIDDRTIQTRPRGEDWIAAGLVSSIPDAGVLDDVDGALQPQESGVPVLLDLRLPVKLRDQATVDRRSKRAKLLLGKRVDGTQIAPDRRAYPFHIDSAMTRAQLTTKWSSALDAIQGAVQQAAAVTPTGDLRGGS